LSKPKNLYKIIAYYMSVKQKTIKKPISISGIGLHTGKKVTMTFNPAPVNHGFKFQRLDLKGEPTINADADFVVDTSRGTTIESNGVRINTVEHTLAACVGLELDNILFSLDGPEPPVMDGSAEVYIDTLLKAGIEEQEEDRVYFDITEYINYKEEDRGVELIAVPANRYKLTVKVDYNTDVIGVQHASLDKISDFRNEVSSSRTFSFLHELEELVSNDLIKGGNIDNAIVVIDKVLEKKKMQKIADVFNLSEYETPENGILNNKKLHHENEPARHKLLDVVGDLALVGMPLNAYIIATKPGHKANVEFAKKIKAYIKNKKNSANVPVYDPTIPPIRDVNAVSKYLPHRYPFLLIDKIIEVSKEHVVAVKNVTVNEPHFQGHFPGNPVMPGVLQTEAMAQAGGMLLMQAIPDPENYTPYFLKLDKVKFKQMVVPGDTLIIRVELMSPIRRGIFEIRCEIFVGDKAVAEAELLARVIKNENA